MKKIRPTHNLFVRITAFLLFVILASMTFGAACCALYAYEDGWYWGGGATFSDSVFCRNMAYREARALLWEIRDDAGNIVLSPYMESGNLRYTIYDSTGETLVTTVSNDAVYKVILEEYDFGGFQNGEHGEYSLRLYLRTPLLPGDDYYTVGRLYQRLYSMRDAFVWLSIVGACLSVALMVFLLCSAGHRTGEEEAVLIRQDRIPLDLYTCLAAGVTVLVVLLSAGLIESGYIPFMAAGAIFLIVALAAVLMAVLMTAAARLKVGKWWRNTVLYRIGHWFAKLLRRGFRLLPIAWRTALAYMAFMLFNLLCLMAGWEGSGLAVLLALLADVAVFVLLMQFSGQLRQLQYAGEKLAEGDLNYKIDTDRLYFDCRKHAISLNSIGAGMSRAVEERMKSERFKAELITNVSHDLKTPLTSIVNYVDLLKKQDIRNEAAREYIEVLERQSARLKKLTEDLVEASKASTGAITVNWELINLSEFMTQMAGEYTERFASCGVESVVKLPADRMCIHADGRLLWRVFDNLMQNICKYALNGTRAYFDVVDNNGNAFITIKNISRSALNVSADTLMERFVRGDESRSTEGSGLGLSIARSLTELQGGKFHIWLDGDMFKVSISFPVVQETPQDTAAAGEPEQAGLHD